MDDNRFAGLSREIVGQVYDVALCVPTDICLTTVGPTSRAVKMTAYYRHAFAATFNMLARAYKNMQTDSKVVFAGNFCSKPVPVLWEPWMQHLAVSSLRVELREALQCLAKRLISIGRFNCVAIRQICIDAGVSVERRPKSCDTLPWFVSSWELLQAHCQTLARLWSIKVQAVSLEVPIVKPDTWLECCILSLGTVYSMVLRLNPEMARQNIEDA